MRLLRLAVTALLSALASTPLAAQPMDKTIVVMPIHPPEPGKSGPRDDHVTAQERVAVEEMIRAEAGAALRGTGWSVLGRAETLQRLRAKGVDPAAWDYLDCHWEDQCRLRAASLLGGPMFIAAAVEREEGKLGAWMRLERADFSGEQLAYADLDGADLAALRAELRQRVRGFFVEAGLLPHPPSAAARARKLETQAEPKSGLDFVHLPGGTFHEGCEPQDSACGGDETSETSTVAPFWMGKTDVTVAAWKRCVQAGACPELAGDDPEHRCNARNGRFDHPVNCVEWGQAAAFCGWLGGRLPAPEEWEYAAKSGESRIYPWGDGPPDSRRANFCDARCVAAAAAARKEHGAETDERVGSTSPAGAFPGGATKWGLLDMAGNVRQWTTADAKWELGGPRGGGFSDGPEGLRTTSRALTQTKWDVDIGFRCVR